MDTNKKSLPSEKLQKEFEDNPFKILENIRTEEEENDIKKIKYIKNELNNIEPPCSNEKHISFNKEKRSLEPTMSETNDNNCNSLTNEKNVQKNYSNRKTNCKKDYNYFINNINNNSIMFYNSKLNYDKNNNITVNNFSIFFNFNNNINSNYVNNFFKNVNNSICIKTDKEEGKNDTSTSQFNTDFDKNNINKYKLILLSNINVLLNNLKTFKGSVICQNFIDNLTDEKECSTLFNNILPNICTIMCLEYGNYFFQKFLKKLNLQQRLAIYKIIEPNFYDIAGNKFGTHSIQSLINNIQSENEIVYLNNLISKNMYFLFVDKNAYHIIMKLILDFPESKRNCLNLFLIMNIDKIIINCNGAFCINKFIIHNKDLNLRTLFINNIKKHIKVLIYNKYSCINLLLILETFGIVWGNFIIEEIRENFGILSENPVSTIFINKVLLFLKNNNVYELNVLLWSLYKNIVLMNKLISNEGNNGLINQLFFFSNDEQKKYLFLFLNHKGNL